MMALLFGQFPDKVYEGEGRSEVRKFVVADEVMFVHDLPVMALGQHATEVVEIFSFEGRNSAPAGYAVAIGE